MLRLGREQGQDTEAAKACWLAYPVGSLLGEVSTVTLSHVFPEIQRGPAEAVSLRPGASGARSLRFYGHQGVHPPSSATTTVFFHCTASLPA